MAVQTLTKSDTKPKAAAKQKDLQPVTPHLVCTGAAEASSSTRPRSAPSR